jgi:pimeloyl-ACP methyl ester carboxylesterase
MAAVLPHAKLVVLPGVGHMAQFAAPERVIQAISELAVREESPSLL